MRNRKKRNIMIFLLCVVTIMIGTGYALLTQVLNVHTVGTISSQKGIVITEVSVDSEILYGKNIQYSYAQNTANFELELRAPRDEVTYRVRVENQGSFDVDLSKINFNSGGLDYVRYRIAGLEEGSTLTKNGGFASFTVTVIFDENVAELPDEDVITTQLSLEYVQSGGAIQQVVVPEPTIIEASGNVIPITLGDSISLTADRVIFDETSENNIVFMRYEYSTDEQTWNEVVCSNTLTPSDDYKCDMKIDTAYENVWFRMLVERDGVQVSGTISDAYTIQMMVRVSLSLEGGTSDTTQTLVQIGSTYGNLPTPTRVGYDFMGWYTKASDGEKIEETSTVTNQDNHSLFARWNPSSYLVYLDAKEGSVSSSEIEVVFDQKYSNLPTPTRVGYDFVGWALDSEGSNMVDDATVVKTAKDHTLYAKYQIKTFILTYDLQGGTGCSSTSSKYNNAWGTLCTPTRVGYDFMGWYMGLNGTGDQLSEGDIATSNLTVYAHWRIGNYLVTFDVNGGVALNETTCVDGEMVSIMGSSNLSYCTKNITYGTTYGELPLPTRDGYFFAGWMTDSSSTFDSNYYSTTYADVKNAFGTNYAALLNHYLVYGKPASENRLCNANQRRFDSTYSSGENQTLYASWIANPTYTIPLNANGGSVSPSSIAVTYNSAYGTLPTPTRDGYRFDGWYTAASGGDNITSSTIMQQLGTENQKTLYAHWSPYILTVNYYGDGATYATMEGTSIANPQTALLYQTTSIYGDYYSSGLANWNNNSFLNIQKTGYTGTNYWTDKNGHTVSQDGALYAYEIAEKFGKNLKTGDVTINIYCQWRETILTVKYYSNGAISGTCNGCSFENTLISLQNRHIYTGTIRYSQSTNLAHYTDGKPMTLRRSFKSATGYWVDDSGRRLSQTAVLTGQNIATTFGSDISHGDATISIKAEWN